MKKLLILAYCFALFLMNSCSSDSSNPVSSGSQGSSMSQFADSNEPVKLVQRPTFVDNRTKSDKDSFIREASSDYLKARANGSLEEERGSKRVIDPNPNPANKYAYVVGISNYEGTSNDLQYADDDAIEIKNFLEGEGFTVLSDLDLDATADNIESGIQWLIDNAVPGDEVAFFYSGHGVMYDSNYGSCIISSDLYYLTHGYVMEMLNDVNCTKKMIAMDCCEIGSFHEDVLSGTYMATASDNTYSYDAPEFRNGAWTYYFLKKTLKSEYAETIGNFAKKKMKLWGTNNGLATSPKNTDKYSGKLDI